MSQITMLDHHEGGESQTKSEAVFTHPRELQYTATIFALVSLYLSKSQRKMGGKQYHQCLSL